MLIRTTDVTLRLQLVYLERKKRMNHHHHHNHQKMLLQFQHDCSTSVVFSVIGASIPAARAADTEVVQSLRYE